MLSEEALAAEGDRGAEEVGQHGEAETARGCPRRWCWNDRRSGGTEGSRPCSWVEEGWLPSKRERRSRRRSPGGRSLLPSAHVWGGAGNGGLAARLPSTGGAIAVRQEAEERLGPSTKDVQYHRMAPRVRASQLVEDRAAACPEPGQDIFFFLFLSPLSRPLSLLILPVSFSLASSVLTPRYAVAALTGPPLGGGGSRAQSRGYPPACEGAMGVWDEWGRGESRGNGARPVELMMMSDTAPSHRFSSPTEELRKD